MKLEKHLLQSLPKVLLHEHLDGVLRPRTVIELAKDTGYKELPTSDPEALALWFHRGANQGSLASIWRVLPIRSQSCKPKRLWSASRMNKPRT